LKGDEIVKKILSLLFISFILGTVSGGCAHIDNYITPEFEYTASTLNTPELIDQYQRANFSYAQTWEGYGCGGVDISHNSKGCSPGYIFKTKKGNCAAHAVFAVYCLRKERREAYVMKVKADIGDARPGTRISRGGKTWVVVDYHYVALYKDQGKWWVMDNGKVRPRGILGPFNSVEESPYKILNIEGKGGK
jgi:hypothetical protein